MVFSCSVNAIVYDVRMCPTPPLSKATARYETGGKVLPAKDEEIFIINFY